MANQLTQVELPALSKRPSRFSPNFHSLQFNPKSLIAILKPNFFSSFVHTAPSGKCRSAVLGAFDGEHSDLLLDGVDDAEEMQFYKKYLYCVGGNRN